MNKRQRSLAIAARLKLKHLTPCDDACPGWAVFDCGGVLMVCACIDCWNGSKDPLLDEEATAMVEAQALLKQESKESGVPIYEDDTYTSWS